jgi:Xaa-Pro dipeptidase
MSLVGAAQESIVDAFHEAKDRLRLPKRSRMHFETLGLTPPSAEQIVSSLGPSLVIDNQLLRAVRAVKTAEEIQRLAWAASLAERGMASAIATARLGSSEQEVAEVIAATMASGGGMPSQLSVQVGSRTTLGDAFPSTDRLMPGDLLRMDVGCRVDGYWSDIARMAVLGEPSKRVRRAFEALKAGQEHERDIVRSGLSAAEVFSATVSRVRESGLPGYKRTHCGHGIGLEVYDVPRITEGNETILQEGMVLCLETPYYEIGLGGLLVEDTVVVTEEDHIPLTNMERDLAVIAI